MADVPDPYGIDIALDGNGDVVVWPNGAMGTIDGPANCVQALQSRMLTFPGELTLHPDYGSTFPSLVGGKLLSFGVFAGVAANEVRKIVAQDARFLAGQNIHADAVAGNPEAVRVGVKLVLAAGDTIDVADLANPAVDEVVSPSAAELDDLAGVTDFEDFDFLAQDDVELAELADAAAIVAVTQPDPDVEAF